MRGTRECECARGEERERTENENKRGNGAGASTVEIGGEDKKLPLKMSERCEDKNGPVPLLQMTVRLPRGFLASFATGPVSAIVVVGPKIS